MRPRLTAPAIGAAAALVFASATGAEEGFPKLNPLSPVERSLDYGLTAGCLPFLVEGGSIHERIERSSGRTTLNGRPADRLHGRSTILIQEDGPGCYLVAPRGDPDRLREAVLATLRRVGGDPRVRFDSGPGSRDSLGAFRQESWCFAVDGRPAGLVMSTSSVRRRHAMQASLFIDRDGACRREP